MKQYLIVLTAILFLSACGSKSNSTPQQPNTQEANAEFPEEANIDSVTYEQEYAEAESQAPSDEDIICTAIENYLLGRPGAAILTDRAKADLSESSWPEVQCSVEGGLDSPRNFKNLKVKVVGPGLYKYECVCPDHGDKFVDFCTMEAYLARDGETVFIEGIKWDDAVPE